MQVVRTDSDALVVNKLPDGSTVIVDAKNETVFALNATAGAAWDACSDRATLSGITEHMQRSLDPKITEEFAEEAILRLQEQKLVTILGSQPNRRQFIATLGAAALPLVHIVTTRGAAGTRTAGWVEGYLLDTTVVESSQRWTQHPLVDSALVGLGLDTLPGTLFGLLSLNSTSSNSRPIMD